jgi:hypothetical protein
MAQASVALSKARVQIAAGTALMAIHKPNAASVLKLLE